MVEHAKRGLLAPFLGPRSIAIVGLSRSAVGSPVSILTTLADLGYPGTIHIVNPAMPSAPGAAVVARIEDLPAGIELAIVSVERTSVPDTLEACVAMGIGSAIVITQGFADADEVGEGLQKRIVDICRRTGLRVIGPNTIGVTDLATRFSSSFIEMGSGVLPVGQVAQSGFLMMGHHLVNNETAGYRTAIDLGNAADIGLLDVLEHFAADDAIEVIECHMEAVDDGPAFIELAKRITAKKPMVVLKAGRTEAGNAAVASHTGNVAGKARIYDAAFRQAGIVVAESAEELRLFSKTFATYGSAAGRRVAVMSFSGGGSVLAIDAIDRAGLELAVLSEETLAAIRDLFPTWIGVHNPLDIWIPVARDLGGAFPRLLEALLRDPAVDAVLCVYCSYTQPKYQAFDVAPHIRRLAAGYPEKPILGWSYGLDIEGTTRRIEADGTAMVFPSLDAAARAIAALAGQGERARSTAPASPVVRSVHDIAKARAILERAAATDEHYLFADGFRLLEAYGFSIPAWRHAGSAGEVAEVAADLHGSLCLKVDSPDVVHKSDLGGVMLGVPGGPALPDRARELVTRVTGRVPGARLRGIVLQEMATPGVEIMLGMVRDPTFGPCLVVGAGGVLAEVLDDFAFAVAPVDAEEARRMIAATRASVLLDGVRGAAPADREAIVDALVRLSDLALAHPEIEEIDLNPVFAGPDGAVIVDVRMMLAGAPS